MPAPKKNTSQLEFFSSPEDLLSHKHPLFIRSDKINWQQFDAFSPLYCSTKGRPAKPIYLMEGLLMFKYIRNIPDESMVEQWRENNYYQYFFGEKSFDAAVP